MPALPEWIADGTLLLVHAAATHRAVQQRSASACIGIEAQGLPRGHVRQVVLGLDFAVKDGKHVDLDRLQPWHAWPGPEVGASISLSMPASGGLTDLGFDEALASFRHPAGSWRSGMTAENWVNQIADVPFTHEATAFIARTHGSTRGRCVDPAHARRLQAILSPLDGPEALRSLSRPTYRLHRLELAQRCASRAFSQVCWQTKHSLERQSAPVLQRDDGNRTQGAGLFNGVLLMYVVVSG